MNNLDFIEQLEPYKTFRKNEHYYLVESYLALVLYIILSVTTIFIIATKVVKLIHK